MWDVRSVACMATIDLGPHPANRLDFDPSGTVLGVASNDGTVKMIEVATGQATELTAHEDAVQSVLFDRIGEFLVSGGSDGTVRIWSQWVRANGQVNDLESVFKDRVFKISAREKADAYF